MAHGLTLWGREGWHREGVEALGRARATCCQQRARLPHFRPHQALSTSRPGWEAGLCFLFQETRSHLSVLGEQQYSSYHLESRAVLG